MKAFAVMDRNGELVAVAASVEDAVGLAQEEAAGAPVYFDGPGVDLGALPAQAETEDDMPLAANPAHLRAPANALKLSKLGTYDFGKLMESMSEQEAWERLRGYFPSRWTKGKLKAYASPTDMAANFLGQNYKTEKDTPRGVRALVRERTGLSHATVMGLSLLPHTQVFNPKAPGGDDVKDIVDEDGKKRYGLAIIKPPKVNLCSRATDECMGSCLVFSGRNLADDYNTVKKFALVQALLGDPEAFIRMLGRAVQRHVVGSRMSRKVPLVRLNVFSDIPWELVVPGIFEWFDGKRDDAKRGFVQFYDYTKVPGRKTPSNYDITFSYAGTEGNVEGMDHEILRNKRRVAVVFGLVGHRRVKGVGLVEVPKKPPKGPRGFPETWAGLSVVDGDKSDLRPYDPAPSIVALRWKTPANQGMTLVEAGAFVVRGAIVEGHFICAETPTRTLDYAGVSDDG